MAIYEFQREQILRTEEDRLWAFVSSPKNLGVITPASMDFKILTEDLAERIYGGQTIRYYVRPVCRIRMTWVSEITEVKEKKFFVDEQRKGPYKMWRHEHHIEKTPEGLKMIDKITYQPPLGIMGVLANRLFIRKRLNHIFSHREKVFDELFN